MPASVFDYSDPATFLRDWFLARNAGANRRYTHRMFARAAGLSNPSALLNVISGRRRITDRTVGSFLKGLRLGGQEAAHFCLLVEMHNEEDPDKKERLREAVHMSRKRALVRELVGEEPDFLRTWYEPAVLELARCAGFQPNAAWVADHLLPRIREEDAAAALETLVRLGLLERTPEGELLPRDVSVKTPEVVQNVAARMYHTEMIERALAALDRVYRQDAQVTPDACWFGGVTLSVPVSLVGRLRREIVELQHRVMAIADAAEEPRERVMQFQFLLFPLSAAPDQSEAPAARPESSGS